MPLAFACPPSRVRRALTWTYVGNWNVNQFPAIAVANPGQVASSVVNAPPLNLVPNDATIGNANPSAAPGDE